MTEAEIQYRQAHMAYDIALDIVCDLRKRPGFGKFEDMLQCGTYYAMVDSLAKVAQKRLDMVAVPDEPLTARTTYSWTVGGDRWECDAYDHGPFCRLCRKVSP